MLEFQVCTFTTDDRDCTGHHHKTIWVIQLGGIQPHEIKDYHEVTKQIPYLPSSGLPGCHFIDVDYHIKVGEGNGAFVFCIHWGENGVMFPKYLSMDAPECVNLTTSCVDNDEYFVDKVWFSYKCSAALNTAMSFIYSYYLWLLQVLRMITPKVSHLKLGIWIRPNGNKHN